MADIRETRRKVITVLVILLVVDAIAGAILLSPIGAKSTARQQELAQLQRDLQVKTAEVAPLQGIDKKVDDAKQQINGFFANRLPTRYSQIADELGKIAQENHVQFSTVHYTTEDTDLKNTYRVTMDGSLAGDYTQVMRFINALERSKMLFLVNGVMLGQDSGTTAASAATGGVRLSIKLETYMAAGAPLS